jgi:hypothetical protein
MPDATGIVHIAALSYQFESIIRQRCSWCGAVLIDADLSMIAFQPNDDGSAPSFPVWEGGRQILRDGHVTSVIDDEISADHEGGIRVDDRCCMRIPRETTVNDLSWRV